MHLSYELADERKVEGGRQLAGLYLKNTIAAKVRLKEKELERERESGVECHHRLYSHGLLVCGSRSIQLRLQCAWDIGRMQLRDGCR